MPFCDQVPSPPIPQKDLVDMAGKSYETHFMKLHKSKPQESVAQEKHKARVE